MQSRRLEVVARAGLPGLGMLGTKAGMTQIYADDGRCFAATVIGLDEGNIVTQVRFPPISASLPTIASHHNAAKT